MSRFNKAFIPFRGYYSSPFCRWQGSLANENAILLGAKTANRWFKQRKLDPTVIAPLSFSVEVVFDHWTDLKRLFFYNSESPRHLDSGDLFAASSFSFSSICLYVN